MGVRERPTGPLTSIQISAVLCGAATGELQILEAQNAAVCVNSTAVITVYGSDYLDYCKFKSSLGINEFFACNDCNLADDY